MQTIELYVSLLIHFAAIIAF